MVNFSSKLIFSPLENKSFKRIAYRNFFSWQIGDDQNCLFLFLFSVFDFLNRFEIQLCEILCSISVHFGILSTNFNNYFLIEPMKTKNVAGWWELRRFSSEIGKSANFSKWNEIFFFYLNKNFLNWLDFFFFINFGIITRDEQYV